MAKCMIIHPNMRWDIVKFKKLENNKIEIKLLKEKKIISGTIDKENDITKVIRVILDEDNKKVHIADFDEIDNFFEKKYDKF
jgi:hypothetical protein